MNKIKLTSLILLLLVILDASGDACRLEGWQLLHHVIESFQIAGWIVVWALFDFNLVYIVMYLLGRFIAFDLVFNIWAGNEILYVGESSLYGRLIRSFADLVHQNYQHFMFIFKFMALMVWGFYFSINKQFRKI